MGRVVGCDECGLRGPASPSVDDDIHIPLALFSKHCLVNRDLLEACKELINRLDIVRLRGYVGHELVNDVRAAIAKAQGKET